MIPADIVRDPKRWNEFDFPGFIARNSREVRWPQIQHAAATLKAKYRKVGVAGFCFGGWAAFELGSDGFSPRLVDCMCALLYSFLPQNKISAFFLFLAVVSFIVGLCGRRESIVLLIRKGEMNRYHSCSPNQLNHKRHRQDRRACTNLRPG